MKKLYFLLFLACSFIANAQIVNIPDANFKTKLIQQGVDTNDDTQIQVSEAEAISILNVYGASITDLTGIEAFVNLTYLDCGNNNLTSLDVSACVNLTELSCGLNNLTSLDVSGCVNLTYLYCNDNNNLTSLDVSGCVNLTYLYCNDNDNLTSLDVSGCVDLIYLYCNLTYLTSLDVSNNINLTYLDCSWNNLTSLDVSNNINLTELSCGHNNLTSLDVSACVNLTELSCGLNNLTSLDVSGCVNLTYLYCNDNNNLTSLDVSGCVNLTYLYCNDNDNLTSLDVSGCVDLIYLYCNLTYLTSLDVSNNINLTYLDCSWNNLTSLDVSNNINLTELSCGHNNLTSLDVSNNINLTELICSGNYLTSLDVSNNVNLNTLNCGGNNLTSLDVSYNINLTSLNCNNNNLTSLDVSNNLNLNELYCGSINLTSLDVSNNINLTHLYCVNNNLTSLDVSNNDNLTYLNCGSNNNLTSLNIKNGNLTSWLYLYFSNNPNLQFICADDEDIDLVQQKINTDGYGSTCHVNSYCSFTPNGTFYDITGNTKLDFNNNGCDVADINYPNLKISITDGTNSGSFISNNSGDYYIPVQAGNYTVTPNLENPTYFNISPANFTVDFPTQASPFTQDFCVTANGVHSDVEILVMPTNPARPGFDADYKIVYKNKGNQIENGTVSLTFDDAVLDYVTSNPVYDSNATNSFTWNYNNLQPFETREIEITFNVNSPMESPSVNIDDVLDYSVAIITSNTEETPDDNTFELNQTVVGSFDPNDKTCLEGETVDVATVGKYVHYVIRFENTGTYPAQNIVVKDMIDTSKFDVSTLVPLDGSHEFYTRIKDNKVEFIFENINLDFNDATNDGYVSFKIKTLPTLTVGETFSNDANIYFDYNFPITTNEYVTTIQNVLSNQDFVFENEFVLYPNPVKEVLNISSKNQTEISSIEIYNIVGQVVIAIPNTTKIIDVSNLKTGTYFIKVNSETGTTTTKFVKE